MSFTEFDSKAGGSNMNAGTLTGTGVVSVTPLVTYAAGDWTAATDIYVAPVGADFTGVAVGQFAALYHDGDTSPTTNQYLVARITAVDTGTRSITLSTTVRALLGTEVANGTGNRSLTIGGAWSVPSGTSGFPLSFVTGALVDASSNQTRLNLTGTFDITAAITNSNSGNAPLFIEGYTSTYGDGGRFELDGGTSGASYVPLTITGQRVTLRYYVIDNNGASGSASGLVIGGSASKAEFGIVRNVRGYGINLSGAGTQAVGNEVHNFNQSNTSGLAGITTSSNDGQWIEGNFVHSATGSNTSGLRYDQSCAFVDNIIYNMGLHGVSCPTASALRLFAKGNRIHTVGGSCVSLVGNTTNVELVNNIFCAWTAQAVAASGTLPRVAGRNNAYFGTGSGTTTGFNTSPLTGDITLTVDPFVDAASGDFDLNSTVGGGASVRDAGWATYLQTGGGLTGTTAKPSVGGAYVPAAAGSSGGGSRFRRAWR